MQLYLFMNRINEYINFAKNISCNCKNKKSFTNQLCFLINLKMLESKTIFFSILYSTI